MSLPLQTLTFYRMPDQTVAVATVAGVLDALYTGWTSAVDYRGTALASTHVWTNIAKQTSGTTVAVHGEKPSGSPMALNPGVVFAGAAAAAGTIAMASPDTFSANALMVGIGKNIGAFTAFDAANPWTSGQWFGYWLGGPALLGALTTTVRVYVSQEVVLVDAWYAATNHSFMAAGAHLEPFTDMSGTTCESDSRLYGLVTAGGSSVNNNFLSMSSTTSWTDHGTSAGNTHGGVFQPGTSSLYPGGRSCILQTGALSQQTDQAGNYIGEPIVFCRSSGVTVQGGATLGRLREIYYAGLLQGGLTRRNGSTDLFHVLGVNSSAADDALIIKAVP